MKIFFSKRHFEAIKQKKFPISFSKPLRTTILRLLKEYSDYGGWDNVENITFDQAEESLKTFWGKDQIVAFDNDGNRSPTNFNGIILSGYPSEVIDAIEAWFDQKPNKSEACEKDLNDALSMNNSQWRFVNSEAMLVNSDYIHEEIQAKTLHLLKSCKALGALDEFQGAIQDLQVGDNKDAIVKAHKSVESVMKVALETDGHVTFGRLLADLIKSGIIPEYYEEFLTHFEKLALGSVKERNRPGRGHGQGADISQVDRSLAEFAINLAGSVDLFIIQRWLEFRKVITDLNKEDNQLFSKDDIPF